jgi:hypothetical protein
MDWRCGSSGREPALQVQNPKFKHQSHQKKKQNLHLYEFEEMNLCYLAS